MPRAQPALPGTRCASSTVRHDLLKILRCADIPYTVHGFRSAFRDWAAEQTSYPGEVAEAALAHTVANKVEAAYRRTNYLDMRRVMMADWAIYCTSQNR